MKTRQALKWLKSKARGLHIVRPAMAVTAIFLISGPTFAQATKMALLVPDATNLSSPATQAWLDGVRELGYELVPYSNAQLLADGTSALLKYRALIVPDEDQQRMSDELVSSIKQYVSLGGKLMLVYDAGVLDPQGFYPITGGSRFSDMVGVTYGNYSELLGNTIGLGPVTGTLQTMRALLVPPGKSTAYTQALASTSVMASSAGTTTFLATSSGNRTGLKTYDHAVYSREIVKPSRSSLLRVKKRQRYTEERGTFPLRSFGTSLRSGSTTLGAAAAPSATTGDPDDAYLPVVEPAVTQTHTVTGYGYGVLSYPSFVTSGTYTGTPLLASPVHGLQAGMQGYGAGSVLFVNLPLSYLKRQTDGMLLNGFVDYFARRVVGAPQMSQAPGGRPGLVFNWHLDNKDAQSPTLQLLSRGVFNRGPYSIHMTAGPDTITAGDGLGWNLPANSTAQSLLRYFDRIGHQVGNHGGWIHDFYGTFASETNGDTFLNYLVLNNDAVTGAIGHKTTEYSAPEGNNPLWAMNWLEQQGIKAYYFLGHTGMGPTRSWRNGTLLNPTMWAVPLTTFSSTATFEEWQELGIAKADVTAWYKALVAFSNNKQTARQVYAHPPGAMLWYDVLSSLLGTVSQTGQSSGFRWYTMTALADHMNKRLNTNWSTSRSAAGHLLVDAANPATLAGVSWTLKKAWYGTPVVKSGTATVTQTATDWLVNATGGTALQFEVQELPR